MSFYATGCQLRAMCLAFRVCLLSRPKEWQEMSTEKPVLEQNPEERVGAHEGRHSSVRLALKF